MKKSILKLGKALNKAQQKQIKGGLGNSCSDYGSYYVSSCDQCVNTISPGAPVSCLNNCCIQAT